MDYEKLIEQLKGISNGLAEDEFPKCANAVRQASTALSMTQAANEKLRDELEQVKRCIEIVEKQRDAAVTDLMSVGKGECWVCTHFRDGGQKCHDCEDGSNWEWRGPKKED